MIRATGVVLRVNDVDSEILGMTVYRENNRQVFLHAGNQGVALFRKQDDMPLTAGNDLNHLALTVTEGGYETLKAELERHGIAVSGRPGEDRCIYFRDPDGHRLQLMVRSLTYPSGHVDAWLRQPVGSVPWGTSGASEHDAGVAASTTA